ncbi:methyl-accepting chemotaxis protein [Desulfocucumis palustris]|uniref:Methyl-accepting chemotaxis protein n=1 Tax=Desulfocucumis palustris TaxID=1898651 RepID=A0A2L2XCL3_9FIRM|nr:methyl-accepting chemotaxis protein [Desulfocucumis palustris]GBF33880.1 methyl-accepting chemotaxis protein [Desulfocucumis palustris]
MLRRCVKIKIGVKITATVLVVILLGVMSQLILNYKMKQANAGIEKEQWWTMRATTALEIKALTGYQNLALAEFVLYGEQEQKEYFDSLSLEAEKMLDEYINATVRQATKDQLLRIKDNQQKFVELANGEIASAVKAGDLKQAGLLLQEKAAPFADEVQKGLDSFADDRLQEVSDQQGIVLTAAAGSVRYGIILTGLAALAGLLIALILSRNITKSLKRIIGQADEIAAGNLAKELPEVNRTDEIGDLARSFKKMEDELRQVISSIKSNSITLAAHSQQLSAASQEVSANVHGMAGVASELAATTENQAANAAAATEVSKNAENVAMEGGKAVQEVVNKMESISVTVNNSTGVMTKLAEQSHLISQIIETITSIADQTNLLALNAAIEAARAGEHGRGFAVVADEVRSLAEKSAQAAKEISAIVYEIRDDIDMAVNAMDAGSKEVNEGVGVVERAGRSLQQIVSNVANSTRYISEISVATEETSLATQDLALSSDHINSAMEHVTQSSISLTSMADEFQEIVSHFNLGGAGESNYWKDREHCSDIMKCREEGRDPLRCGVARHSGHPCWNVKGTHFKGEDGKDVRKCKECEVYKRYGNNEAIVVYEDELLEKL